MQKMGWFGVVRGHSRSWAMPPFDRAHTTSYSTLIETVLIVPFSRYSRLFVESRPVEFRGDLWHQKTRVTGLSCGVVYVILRLVVLVEHRLVTDRQTDRDRHRPTASTADA